MLALTVTQARNIAMAVTIGLVVLSAVMAWLIKSLVMKVLSVAVLVGLAFAVWTQRANLQDCADRLQARADAGVTGGDTTCSFFGQDITVPGIE
jgi:protein-S-isoprenylcysteine O-methyltransferase Ste14